MWPVASQVACKHGCECIARPHISLVACRCEDIARSERLQLTFRLETWCKLRLLGLNFNVMAYGHLDYTTRVVWRHFVFFLCILKLVTIHFNCTGFGCNAVFCLNFPFWVNYRFKISYTCHWFSPLIIYTILPKVSGHPSKSFNSGVPITSMATGV